MQPPCMAADARQCTACWLPRIGAQRTSTTCACSLVPSSLAAFRRRLLWLSCSSSLCASSLADATCTVQRCMEGIGLDPAPAQSTEQVCIENAARGRSLTLRPMRHSTADLARRLAGSSNPHLIVQTLLLAIELLVLGIKLLMLLLGFLDCLCRAWLSPLYELCTSCLLPSVHGSLDSLNSYKTHH